MRTLAITSLWLVPAVLMYSAYLLFHRLGTNRRSWERLFTEPVDVVDDPTATRWSEAFFAAGSSWRAIASALRPPCSSLPRFWPSVWGLPRCSPFAAPA